MHFFALYMGGLYKDTFLHYIWVAYIRLILLLAQKCILQAD